MNSRLACEPKESESTPPDVADKSRVLAWPSRAAIALIEMYQRYISPYTPPTCRFYPTCSCYTREAIARFGLLRGAMLGAWRIVRCNPLNAGGDDPVPEKKEPKAP
jgi:putative membrane protein insertion efficiency factor